MNDEDNGPDSGNHGRTDCQQRRQQCHIGCHRKQQVSIDFTPSKCMPPPQD